MDGPVTCAVAQRLYESGDRDNYRAFMRNVRAVDPLLYAAIEVARLIREDDAQRGARDAALDEAARAPWR